MSQKIDRATHGPGWGEAIFGALLSVLLGVIVGALLLVLRPVAVVKALPPEAERDPDVMYYVEGSREVPKSREAPAKRLAFAGGQSVTLTEDELNALAGTPTAAGIKRADPSVPTDKQGPVAASANSLASGGANFRLHDGALQLGVPLTVNLLGLSRKVIVQARGGFVKESDIFTYDPTQISIGSCPLDRLPLLAHYVRGKFVTSDAIPEDAKASWAKLAKVSVEGNGLKLTMP